MLKNKVKPVSSHTYNLLQISAQTLREKFGSHSNLYTEFVERLRNLLEKIRFEPGIKEYFDNWTMKTEKLFGYKADLSLLTDYIYLIILAKTAAYLKLSKNKPDKKEIIKIINGEYFKEKGISNFSDDFSFWLLNSRIEGEYLYRQWSFVERLSNYDFSRIDEDLFRELYEDIISRKERHKSGEYYTPEWLVALILNEVFDLWTEKNGKAIPKILDPACGSGTFLYRTIKIIMSKGVPLEYITESVAGMDINPIATFIAKANYIMAISDLIENSKEITLPIHTKDSIKSPDLYDQDIRFGKYDIVIGNPPWIVMRSMKSKEYQNLLKKEVLKYKLLENKDVHLFTQMELATLFFCKTADLYLDDNGIIAFIMPGSTLTGTLHHINFRKFTNPPIRLIKIIDLDDVNPLFNMPSCVLIGLKGQRTHYPVLLEKYKGELPNREINFSEAELKLSVEINKYTPPDFSIKSSYYYDKFKVGASIFPRSFYFIELISLSSEFSGFAAKTSEEIYQIVKEPWKVILEGNIEKDFIYATLSAWEMFPFGYIKLRPVALPIKEIFHGYVLMDTNNLQINGFNKVAEWFSKAQEIWDKGKTEKAEKRFPKLLDRLNYNSLLTVQNPGIRYIVLYNATGTNLVSCVIDKYLLPYFKINGKEVKPRGFIADVKTWFFKTDNEVEAYYLCAIFNSEIINKIIKPFQPRGLFGARAIHRRPLLFPIPEFDNNNKLHIKLADISKKCHDKIKIINFIQSNNFRAKVRNQLKSEIVEIDKIVSEILNITIEQ